MTCSRDGASEKEEELSVNKGADENQTERNDSMRNRDNDSTSVQTYNEREKGPPIDLISSQNIIIPMQKETVLTEKEKKEGELAQLNNSDRHAALSFLDLSGTALEEKR